jgi:hypothetical protein
VTDESNWDYLMIMSSREDNNSLVHWWMHSKGN